MSGTKTWAAFLFLFFRLAALTIAGCSALTMCAACFAQPAMNSAATASLLSALVGHALLILTRSAIRDTVRRKMKQGHVMTVHQRATLNRMHQEMADFADRIVSLSQTIEAHPQIMRALGRAQDELDAAICAAIQALSQATASTQSTAPTRNEPNWIRYAAFLADAGVIGCEAVDLAA